jgi:hypothetical protein
MVYDLGLSSSFYADKASIHEVSRVAFDPGRLSVLNMRQNSTLAMTGLANGSNDLPHIHLSHLMENFSQSLDGMETWVGYHLVSMLFGSTGKQFSPPFRQSIMHRTSVFPSPIGAAL